MESTRRSNSDARERSGAKQQQNSLANSVRTKEKRPPMRPKTNGNALCNTGQTNKKLQPMQLSNEAYDRSDTDESGEEEEEEQVVDFCSNNVRNTTCYGNLYAPALPAPYVSIEKQIECKSKRVEEMLLKFISEDVFPVMKFVGPRQCPSILRAALNANTYIDYMGTIPADVFSNHFVGKVSTMFSKMRHKTQCLSRSTFLST